jgi:hypothetical protein
MFHPPYCAVAIDGGETLVIPSRGAERLRACVGARQGLRQQLVHAGPQDVDQYALADRFGFDRLLAAVVFDDDR